MTSNTQPLGPTSTSNAVSGELFPIVGIGASAGGLEACLDLLRHLPKQTGMAFVVIQHLDPTHPSYLSEALARAAPFPVLAIRDGMRVEPDHVYVIPPSDDVGILGGALVLLPRPTEGRVPHLPIDFFFKALAAERKSRAIGVILSGTGSDGSEGLRAIKAEDGIAFAQEPRSAKFSGMPEAAISAGVVDFVLPIALLTEELLRVAGHPLFRGRSAAPLSPEADDRELKKVFVLLRNAMGIDFSEYKPASIRRRIERRLALHRLTTLQDYLPLLRDEPTEAKALCEDICIHVTSFFRDPSALEALKERVFPNLLKERRQNGGPIRIWIAGCSTGEEAYSILISLLEFLADQDASDVSIQLFGTDVSEKAIERARTGFFTDGATSAISAQRLSRYFTRLEGGGYRIHKSVRERCAFARHDLASDPPFSRLDLVSCRNVLIYFGQDLQRRVLSTFQFALNETGFLVLGHAEGIPDGSAQFAMFDKEARVFTRTGARSPLQLVPLRPTYPISQPSKDGPARLSAPDLVRRTESIILDRYSPAGVVVNERMEILHFRGRTSPYLEPPSGQPQYDLLRMARPGLAAELRVAISQAARDNAVVRSEGVQIEVDGSPRVCDLVVIPVASSAESTSGGIFAVLFEDRPSVLPTVLAGPPVPPFASTAVAPGAEQSRVARVESELKTKTQQLQAIVEEHQRTNEELLAANEELISTNEELQSLNEELETAKEELQSTNEELRTLNEELQTRNVELDLVNSDLVNILGSVEIPLVIVDARRRIRRFTPKARPILNLLPSDVGRPIDDIKPNLAVDRLDPKIAEVIDTLVVHEEEVEGRDARWYRLQIRPYLTVDKKIDGAVISVVDIDFLKRALGAAEWARDYARVAVEAVQMPLLILDEKLEILICNEVFHETYAMPKSECHGYKLYAIMGGVWEVPQLRSALDSVIRDDQRFQKLEAELEIPTLGRRSMLLSGRSVRTPGGERMILLAVEDTTERRRGEAERAHLLEEARAARASAEQANQAKDVFLATLSHELRTPLSTLLMQSQLLRMGQLDEARIQRAGEAIERAAKAQSQLIDDLLDVSRIVTGKLKMERTIVHLDAILQAAVDAVAPTAEKKQVELSLQLEHSPRSLAGDALRLQQAVMNLLTNAIKFTPSGGQVKVAVDAEDGWGTIRVKDTGIGIDPAFLPQVFERFVQEDHRQTRAHGGLGLGLAIVRHLVEAHGGTVHAESAGRGHGSTFTLKLPLVEEGSHTRPPSPDGPTLQDAVASIRDLRVLIVEDDFGTREALLEMLRLCGAQAQAAESAEEAMSVFETFRPEVLVCDVALPQEDGYSLIRRIRSLGPGRGGNVPALALTALAGAEDRCRALEAGFQVHVAKPIDLTRLAQAMAGVLGRHAAAEAQVVR